MTDGSSKVTELYKWCLGLADDKNDGVFVHRRKQQLKCFSPDHTLPSPLFLVLGVWPAIHLRPTPYTLVKPLLSRRHVWLSIHTRPYTRRRNGFTNLPMLSLWARTWLRLSHTLPTTTLWVVKLAYLSFFTGECKQNQHLWLTDYFV